MLGKNDQVFAICCKKILITGGVGFIGSNLAPRLVNLDTRVTLVDNLVPKCGGHLFKIAGMESTLNVLTPRYFCPGCHSVKPYRTNDPRAGLRLPQTERLVKKVLCLPTGPAVTSAEAYTICDMIEFVVEHREAVKERFSLKPVFPIREKLLKARLLRT